MKVLITGGRGFIGHWVTQELEKRGHEVEVFSNLSHPSRVSDGRRYIYGDVRYQWDVEQAIRGVDCVIHLAARINVDRSRDHPRPFFDTNILGTFNVLEACRKFKKKMIHASTSEALGSMQQEYELTGMNESHPFAPDNPYGATKASADQLCIGWHKSFDVDVTILRSFNVTGIGQAYDKEGAFIPKVIEWVIKGENPKIFGSGDQTRDYVYVKDVANAYALLCEGNYPGEVFHIGTGREVTIKSVAQHLIDYSHKTLRIEYQPDRPKEVKRLRCDYSKIAKLGWQPMKQIEDVLEEMYDHRFLELYGWRQG